MSEELDNLLDELSPEEQDFRKYPAMLVIFKDDGPEVHLNKWEKLNSRLVRQGYNYVMNQRDRERVKAMKELNKSKAKKGAKK